MNLYELFGTDKSAEVDGIWIDYGAAGRFQLARSGGANTAYKKAITLMYKANKHAIETETMPDDVAEQKTLEIFCKHVLKGWEGVKDRDGKALKFSVDAAITLLSELDDLYADLRAQASKVSNFRAAQIEADSKN